MPAAQTNLKVNLLPNDRFEYSQVGRFLRWALTTGRYVVVMTELIVIMAFLSRFWFDRKLTDLREMRMQKGNIVDSFKQTQIKFEQTQQLLTNIRTTALSSSQPTSALAKIQNLTPAGIQYDSINISSQSANLNGFASSGNTFSRLLGLMQNDETFKNVLVKQLELSKDHAPGLDFVLELVNDNL